VPPPQKIFLNFYIKMVSFGAFWVAISYRLAACFTRSTCGTEIYWRSFRYFGNYNYSLRKIAKNDKNGPKIEIPQILRCFFGTFSVLITLLQITKFHGECDIEIILKIGQLTRRVFLCGVGFLASPVAIWTHRTQGKKAALISINTTTSAITFNSFTLLNEVESTGFRILLIRLALQQEKCR